MNEKEVNELLDLLVDIKNVLKDIGKVLDKQTHTLEFIARESQEKNDWESWKRY